MGSEITARPTLRQKEWEVRKNRVGTALSEIAPFVLRKAKDMIGDIRAIKEKELWKEGGYHSFHDFVTRMIGLSQRHVYRLLNEDDDTRNALEIREIQMTLCHNSEPTTPPAPTDTATGPPETLDS